MKNIKLLTVVIALLLLAGCGNDPITPVSDGLKITTDYPGYIRVEVITVGTPDAVSISTGDTPDSLVTATVQPITKPMNLTITGQQSGFYTVTLDFEITTGHKLGDFWTWHK